MRQYNYQRYEVQYCECQCQYMNQHLDKDPVDLLFWQNDWLFLVLIDIPANNGLATNNIFELHEFYTYSVKS